jgi:hypothetical protein
MKTQLFVLTLIFGLGLGSALAQSNSPSGTYGVLIKQWPKANAVSSALIGVFNFDGAGNLTGTYTLVGAAPAALAGTLMGSYTTDANGVTTVNVNLDAGFSVTSTVLVTDGGAGLEIILSGGSALDPGTVVSGTGKKQASAPPSGTYAYLVNQLPDAVSVPVAALGTFNLDGAGNVTGTYTVVGLAPAPISGKLAGTYSTNLDGTIIATLSAGGPSFMLTMVATDGGSELEVLATGGSVYGPATGTVAAGTARLQ